MCLRSGASAECGLCGHSCSCIHAPQVRLRDIVRSTREREVGSIEVVPESGGPVDSRASTVTGCATNVVLRLCICRCEHEEQCEGELLHPRSCPGQCLRLKRCMPMQVRCLADVLLVHEMEVIFQTDKTHKEGEGSGVTRNFFAI